jgi:hypothetical protein
MRVSWSSGSWISCFCCDFRTYAIISSVAAISVMTRDARYVEERVNESCCRLLQRMRPRVREIHSTWSRKSRLKVKSSRDHRPLLLWLSHTRRVAVRGASNGPQRRFAAMPQSFRSRRQSGLVASIAKTALMTPSGHSNKRAKSTCEVQRVDILERPVVAPPRQPT